MKLWTHDMVMSRLSKAKQDCIDTNSTKPFDDLLLNISNEVETIGTENRDRMQKLYCTHFDKWYDLFQKELINENYAF